jgi:hypothetical protein
VFGTVCARSQSKRDQSYPRPELVPNQPELHRTHQDLNPIRIANGSDLIRTGQKLNMTGTDSFQTVHNGMETIQNDTNRDGSDPFYCERTRSTPNDTELGSRGSSGGILSGLALHT